jgi:hypothetical protein
LADFVSRAKRISTGFEAWLFNITVFFSSLQPSFWFFHRKKTREGWWSQDMEVGEPIFS